MRMKWSKSSVMSELGWWMVSATVRPLAAMFFSVRMMETAISESRPLVGSSRKRQVGDVMSSTPTDVRRFSPPDTPLMPAVAEPIYVFAQDVRPYARAPDHARCAAPPQRAG
jgi:hypothetical protein